MQAGPKANQGGAHAVAIIFSGKHTLGTKLWPVQHHGMLNGSAWTSTLETLPLWTEKMEMLATMQWLMMLST